MKTHKDMTVKETLMLEALKEAALVIAHDRNCCLESVVSAIQMFDEPWLRKHFYKKGK